LFVWLNECHFYMIFNVSYALCSNLELFNFWAHIPCLKYRMKFSSSGLKLFHNIKRKKTLLIFSFSFAILNSLFNVRFIYLFYTHIYTLYL